MPAVHIQIALILALLAGIAYRRRWEATVMFPAYLAVGVAHKGLQAGGWLGPDDWLSWLGVQLTQRVLVLGTGVEIAARMFHRRLPGGRAWTARALLLVVGLGCAAAVAWGLHLSSVRTDGEFYGALVEADRRLAATSLWVFVAVFWLAVVRFGWPVDPYHRDVALGFAVYQAALMLASPHALASRLLPASWPVWLYGAVLLLWLLAAWRPADLSRIAPALRPFVWPWARVRP